MVSQISAITPKIQYMLSTRRKNLMLFLPEHMGLGTKSRSERGPLTSLDLINHLHNFNFLFLQRWTWWVQRSECPEEGSFQQGNSVMAHQKDRKLRMLPDHFKFSYTKDALFYFSASPNECLQQNILNWAQNIKLLQSKKQELMF